MRLTYCVFLVLAMLLALCHADELTFELVTDDLLTLQDSTSWISTADIDQDGLVDIIASKPTSTMALFEQSAPGSTDFVLLDDQYIFLDIGSCHTFLSC